MSDQNPVSPEVVDAPTNGETSSTLYEDDDVKLYGAGWVRVIVDGKDYRLRRPLVGELKDLRLSLERLTDEITEKSEANYTWQLRADRRHRQLNELLLKLPEDPDLTDDEFEAKVTEWRGEQQRLRLDSRNKGRDLTTFADERRMAWWSEVFEVLGVDGPPPQWPAFFVDFMGPMKVTEHWRQNPLARG